MKLHIGNKNDSSWSMRPWVLLKQAEIPFEEVMLRFDDLAAARKLPGVAAWIADALLEKKYVEIDEPCRERSGALGAAALS